jgi:hypothetical protein
MVRHNGQYFFDEFGGPIIEANIQPDEADCITERIIFLDDLVNGVGPVFQVIALISYSRTKIGDISDEAICDSF